SLPYYSKTTYQLPAIAYAPLRTCYDAAFNLRPGATCPGSFRLRQDVAHGFPFESTPFPGYVALNYHCSTYLHRSW
ncbi:hypothetical protein M413DRAFT_450090, partial [Hebeloma cylindrosporum]